MAAATMNIHSTYHLSPYLLVHGRRLALLSKKVDHAQNGRLQNRKDLGYGPIYSTVGVWFYPLI